MRVMVLLLALASALILAADNAVVAPQSAANLQSTVVGRQSPVIGTEAITIPQMLSYQGKLTDTLGQPVADTTYSVTFGLYTQPTGGSPFWNETQTVETRGGLFSTLLGSVTPIGSMPDAGAAYLGMAVGWDLELAPRLRIASAAYAYLSERAANADALQGKDTTGFVQAGQANSVTSAMIVNGTVAAADIADTNVTMAKMARAGASPGQVIKWTGSAWAPGNDSVGSGGIPDSIPGSLAIGGELRVHSKVRLGYSCYNGGDAAFCAGYGNNASGDHSSVTGGEDNGAGGRYSHISGGSENRAEARWSAVGGGNSNEAYDTAASVAGGRQNYAMSPYATVGGGQSNAATGRLSTVGGGYGNVASDTTATVSGGYDNAATARYSFVGGGKGNEAESSYAMVGGGRNNWARHRYATVAGGESNDAWGLFSTVGGGYENLADTTNATVAGGAYNSAAGRSASVGGGSYNAASDEYCTVAGGRENHATSVNATVGGGIGNEATSGSATVAGGHGNTASRSYSTVGGGVDNEADGLAATVSGGYENSTTSDYSAIIGGYADTCAANYSVVAGSRVRIRSGAAYSLAFGEGCTTSVSRAVVFYHSGAATKLGVGVQTPTHYIDVTGGSYCDASGWHNPSSRELKQDIAKLTPEECRVILQQLLATDVARYKYKADERGQEHIGLIAEEAPAVLTGPEHKAIGIDDAIGFLMAAVKAQQAEIEALKAELKRR